MEASDKEAPDKEAPDKEAPNKEASDKEALVVVGLLPDTPFQPLLKVQVFHQKP